MTEVEIIERLRDDNEYYNGIGRNYLSNSDFDSLFNDPSMFQVAQDNSLPFLQGGYFHTLVLEADKLEKYKVIKASTRSTKIYKDLSEGELCLLQHEVDMIEGWRDKIMGIDFIRELIHQGNVEHETPGIMKLEGEWFKGKADVINHTERLVIDLKSTGSISSFQRSAYLYNYDSQAYIYQQIFGYDMVFVAIDKKTKQVGFFECSDKFLQSGANKVAKAVMIYNELKADPERYKSQHFLETVL